MRDTLGALRKGQSATVTAIVETPGGTLPPGELEARLLEMGFVEGATVEVLHEGLIGRDPIAVRVRGTVIAMRREEASAVQVQS
jgi:ferrous iron transport protein A